MRFHEAAADGEDDALADRRPREVAPDVEELAREVLVDAVGAEAERETDRDRDNEEGDRRDEDGDAQREDATVPARADRVSLR